jgi:Iap family predicted aminopeptidase
MAIAGSAINTAHFKQKDGILHIHWTTTHRDNCVSVEEAIALLLEGKQAIVMPADAQALRFAWKDREP